jgi:putative sterol carrier protein
MIDQAERLQRLLTLVETSPHEKLESAVATEAGSLDEALDAIFAHLVSEFNPNKAKGRRGVFQFDITGETGAREYYVLVENNECTYGRGRRDDADVTIGIKTPDMLLMGMGKLPGAKAFLTGRLRLRGNPLFGTKLGEWFDHPPV